MTVAEIIEKLTNEAAEKARNLWDEKIALYEESDELTDENLKDFYEQLYEATIEILNKVIDYLNDCKEKGEVNEEEYENILSNLHYDGCSVLDELIGTINNIADEYNLALI